MRSIFCAKLVKFALLGVTVMAFATPLIRERIFMVLLVAPPTPSSKDHQKSVPYPPSESKSCAPVEVAAPITAAPSTKQREQNRWSVLAMRTMLKKSLVTPSPKSAQIVSSAAAAAI